MVVLTYCFTFFNDGEQLNASGRKSSYLNPRFFFQFFFIFTFSSCVIISFVNNQKNYLNILERAYSLIINNTRRS